MGGRRRIVHVIRVRGVLRPIHHKHLKHQNVRVRHQRHQNHLRKVWVTQFTHHMTIHVR